MKVIDTSAVIATVLGEHGSEHADQALFGGAMSTVNAAECLEVLIRKNYTPERAEELLLGTGLDFLAPDMAVSRDAACLAKHRGLSLGDRFCIALARALNVPVVTADRAFSTFELGVPVELIR
ncbi:MAG: PIN domain-containing protein [Hyphomonadaceae bacterium]|jgi:PIN domain nuclease of toxin-antitoxin system|nr:PIN domain-containing protein [Hyphomonadaceae bacterium]